MRNFKSTLVGMCLAVSSLGLTAFFALTAPITIPTRVEPRRSVSDCLRHQNDP
jgi:hypothetical protein